MTITPHLLAGSALATATTDNILVAFLIGFFLHFVLDCLPHIDPGTFHNFKIPGFHKEINLETLHADDKPWPLWIYVFCIVEFLIIVPLVILMFHNRPDFGIIVAGGLGGIFVDGLDNPVFNFILRLPVLKQIHYLHHRFHYNLPASKWYWGLLIELIVIGLSLWLLLRF